MITSEEAENYNHLRDCLSSIVIEKFSTRRTAKSSPKRRSKGRKNSIKNSAENTQDDSQEDDPAELSDFIEVSTSTLLCENVALSGQYLSADIYASLPDELRTISYAVTQNNPNITEKYTIPLESDIMSTLVERISPTISDSFCSYGLVGEPSDLERFLEPVFNNYLTAATSAPPEYTPALIASRPDGCEICAREHLQLTYHHLIPRQIHAKAVKRGWHKEWQLNKVCWLVGDWIVSFLNLLESLADRCPFHLSVEHAIRTCIA